MSAEWIIGLTVVFAIIGAGLGIVWIAIGHRKPGDFAIAFMMALGTWLFLCTILFYATGAIKGGL